MRDLVEIAYTLEPGLDAEEFIDVLRRSTLAERRPVEDVSRIIEMLRHADIIVAARNPNSSLVGISRAISDFSYCTYLSDLAVDHTYQGQGIGRSLLRKTHETAGLNTTLILLSAPQARTYYPHVGMKKHDECWIIPESPAFKSRGT